MAAVSAQASRLGITVKGIADAQVQGDVLLNWFMVLTFRYHAPIM
jgi:hypothetical protein